MNEQFEAQWEIKIRPIENGWIVKRKSGWRSCQTIDEAMSHVRDLLTEDKANLLLKERATRGDKAA